MQPSQAQAGENFKRGKIRDVVVYELRKFVDERGWLAELFRHDDLGEEFYPVMAYNLLDPAGVTLAGRTSTSIRQTVFAVIVPSNFKLRMWDNRRDSETFTASIGRHDALRRRDNPARRRMSPSASSHAYRNVGQYFRHRINCPNRLYMGEGKREPVDEIRHEDDPQTIYRIED